MKVVNLALAILAGATVIEIFPFWISFFNAVSYNVNVVML